ncbi:beta-ketoacyl synthase chain length factor [Paludibacterium paludis]|uniref:Beta-ketoacyl synthase-like N-terminal domain-containing protein n=1 Tax=Paludibacterium paludis TaxID=1225769 RepID=A0A918P6K4_9NEIS|nr:beta-ketoacyl synthase chain length factor [Paludibacterium paludis]GGY23016.1 hypothetical protein GCM10011289_28460 [Paludibacterium paludis]
MHAIRFILEDWAAWPPASLPEDSAAPPLPHVPPLQRRRISALGKAALHVAFELDRIPVDNAPLIFTSRHGDLSRSITLLDQLTQGSDLSPTQFGLSVHNAIGALFSILNGDKGHYTAISAGEETAEHALCEASALLDDGAPAVRLIVYDAPMPAPYDHYENKSAIRNRPAARIARAVFCRTDRPLPSLHRTTPMGMAKALLNGFIMTGA